MEGLTKPSPLLLTDQSHLVSDELQSSTEDIFLVTKGIFADFYFFIFFLF